MSEADLPASTPISPTARLVLAILLGGYTAIVALAFASAGYVAFRGFIPLAPRVTGTVLQDEPPIREAVILFAILIGPATLCALCDRLRAAGWVGPLVGAAIGGGLGFLFWLDQPTAAGEFQAVQCHAAWLGAGLAATLLRWMRPR